MNKPELKDLFDRLSEHYKNQVDQGEWEDLPLTIAEIDDGKSVDDGADHVLARSLS